MISRILRAVVRGARSPRAGRRAIVHAAHLVPLTLLSGALYLPLAATDLTAALTVAVAKPMRRRRMTLPPVDTSRVTLIIVSWNGRELLAAGLPSVLREAKAHGRRHEVLVVDNGSNDGTVTFLRRCFPEVRVLALPVNAGFGAGNNLGARAASTDVIVFLNNDMTVEPGFLEPLLRGFSEPDVFAVSSQVLFPDASRRREETGKTRGRFLRGRLVVWHEPFTEADLDAGLVPVLWAGGGAAAFRRDAFLRLGGFDPLYHPFYWEDTDLSYRAWKAGWRCVVAPESRVVHRHRSSTSRFGSSYVERVVRRNEYLFTWRNITDARRTVQHFAMLPLHVVVEGGDHGMVQAYGALLDAVRRYPQALAKRYRSAVVAARSDCEILQASSGWPPSAGSATVDLRHGDGAAQLGVGWHEQEGEPGAGYRWIARQAEVFLHATGGERCLVVEGFLPESARMSTNGRQRLWVRVDGHPAATFHLPHAGPFRLEVPLTRTKPGWTMVQLRARRSFRPAEAGLGNDGRELSLCLTRLALEGGSVPPEAPR